MNKILITGGAGFIGSAMALLLHKKGYDVTILDTPEQIQKNKDIAVIKNKIGGSILDINAIDEAIENCNVVIHLAAKLGVAKTESQRLETLNINILGTKYLLDECIKRNVKKIIFSSSSEVYGNQTTLPIDESAPLQSNSIYATSKLAGEEYIKAYHNKYGIDYTILRFFSVYGPYQRKEFVMSKFVDAVRNNQSPVIFGDGMQIRAFCHVDDIVNGVYLSLTSRKSNSEIFNIGNETEPISMLALAKKIIKLSGKDIIPSIIEFKDSDRDGNREIYERVPSISKAREVLGYKPTVSLDEGIKRLLI